MPHSSRRCYVGFWGNTCIYGRWAIANSTENKEQYDEQCSRAIRVTAIEAFLEESNEENDHETCEVILSKYIFSNEVAKPYPMFSEGLAMV